MSMQRSRALAALFTLALAAGCSAAGNPAPDGTFPDEDGSPANGQAASDQPGSPSEANAQHVDGVDDSAAAATGGDGEVSDETDGVGRAEIAPPATCDTAALRVCLDYGGGNACYAKTSCPATQKVCASKSLQVCLEGGGGDACYPKWGCTKGEDTPTAPAQTTGARFSSYYASNYAAISKQAREFWPNSFACAAFASTSLKMFGFGVKQVLITNDVESQLKAKGWTAIRDLTALRAGDVVFTDKATSNVAGTYSHVYVFHKYTSPGYALISDNNGNNITRNVGPGSRSRSVIAYRAP